jgi:NAD+ synthase (glutamine-hydrolysing)
MTLKICIAQLNFVVGDLAGNAQKIIDASRTAYNEGARLVLTPELSICGYAAEDLFLRPAFIAACHDAVKRVADELAALKDLTVVVGHPTGGDRRTRSVAVQDRLNAASVLRGGDVVATYAKRELPNYQVFDERRYFTPGQGVCVFEAGGFRIGLLICEDAWFESPARLAKEAGAELLAVINASPFHVGKGYEREATMRERVRVSGLPLVYAHLVGGQDEVVFEGHSFVVGADAEIAGRAPSFEEKLFYASVKRSVGAIEVVAEMVPERALDADLWDALVLGVRDYIGKNGFPGVLLGLSGGIDSALVLAVAVDALGRDRVRAVMMPSPYTADISWIDARDMASALGVRYDEISIVPEFEAFKASLAPQFAGLAEDTTEENIQARIRGTLLMALSNKTGAHGADHRQQERDGHRLLHAVRRHGGWLCGDQGRGQDRSFVWRAGATPTIPMARAPVRSPSASSPAHPAPSCGPTRRTRTACRPMRCWTPLWSATWRTTRHRGDRGARLCPGGCREGDAADQASTNTSADSPRWGFV